MADTVARLSAVVAARGMKVFAVIDHSDEARSVGLALRDTKLFIVGSPSVSTAAMGPHRWPRSTCRSESSSGRTGIRRRSAIHRPPRSPAGTAWTRDLAAALDEHRCSDERRDRPLSATQRGRLKEDPCQT